MQVSHLYLKMFRYLLKPIPCSKRSLHLCRLYSTSSSVCENQESFTAKYLMNQFGFSKQRATLYSSKYIKFENSDKPDKLLGFFKNQGFTHSQVTKLVANYPLILSCNPQTTLLPKVEFFRSKGFSAQDLATTIACMPMLLVRSLKKCIVPSFNFITDFVGSEKDAILAISKDVRILVQLESHVKPNIQILFELGMPKSKVAFLMKTRPSIFVSGKDKLKKFISSQNGHQDSFTAQYLMNKLGFSVERAVLYSSKYLYFENSVKPDSVLAFFKTQGFTESQITKLVAKNPVILSCNPQNTLLPKIQYFKSLGVSDKDVARIFELIPGILAKSLEKFNCIIPSFTFIQDFMGSEKDAILAVSYCSRILIDVEGRLKPTIRILVGAGMSQSAIARLMKYRPHLFVSDSNRLKESVKLIQNMKLDPESCSYGFGLAILTATRRATWDKRMDAFKRWGCSEDDVLMSFKICPFMMMISEERLNGIMSLFVHEMGWEPSEVVKRYFMFTLSLKKRMIPRWSVYKELLSKGLVKNVHMGTMLLMKEEKFLKMFVNCYKDEAPALLKLYMEKQK